MKLFNDKALEVAKTNVSNLYAKLANTAPTEQWTLDDIRSLMFYLEDYKDELESIQYERKMKKLKEARQNKIIRAIYEGE